MQHPRKVVLVVDPFSTCKYIAQMLLLRGRDLLALTSSEQVTPEIRATYVADHYLAKLSFDQDFNSNLQELVTYLGQHYEIESVIAGSEMGVTLADELNDRLQSWCANVYSLSAARRNKFIMQETIKAAGLNSIPQWLFNSLEAVLVHCEQPGCLPCVIKPTASSGSDGVTFCATLEDVKTAARLILESRNTSGDQNREVLVQAYVEGPEYVVDSVSYRGKHLLCCIWKYTKSETSNAFVYDMTIPIAYETDAFSVSYQLTQYVHDCLTALGVKFGASHAEVKMSPSGPCLIEMGARTHGLRGPEYQEIVTGLPATQHFLTTDVFTNKGRFFRRKYKAVLAGDLPYKLLGFGLWVDLQATQTGVLVEDIETTAAPLLKTLKSCKRTYFLMKKGDPMLPTRDIKTIPGGVFLFDADEQRVRKDYQTLKVWQSRGMLWQVEAASPKLAHNHSSSTLDSFYP